MSTVTGFIGTSGLVAFFLFDEGSLDSIWASQADDPTISVVGGGTDIPLTGRTAYAITSGFGPPYVSYPLATKIEPEDVVTFSAPEGWVSFGVAGTAPAAVDEPVTNWSGVEMFPFAGEKTLKLGMNITGPHPTQPVDILRDMLRHTNSNADGTGGNGVLSRDANFIPTAISGEASWNCQNRVTANGYNDRGTGGAEGTYIVTWKDRTVLRDRTARIAAHFESETIVAEVGSKQTIETTAEYTKYRRTYTLAFAPGRLYDALGFNTYYDGLNVDEVEVVGPGEDPDSTEIISGYAKEQLAGIANFRHVQDSEGIGSNCAIFAHCRQRGDLSTGQYRAGQQSQLTQVEAIPACSWRWNGETATIADKWTLASGGVPFTTPIYAVGLYCTTATPHGLYTFQGVNLNNIYNDTFANPDDPDDHNGVQVDGIAGSIWMGFGGQYGVPCHVVDDTHFIVYPGYVVQTAGVADPIGVQTFDNSAGRSTLSVFTPTIGSIAYEDQIRMCSEMVPPASAHLCISECMTDQGVADLAAACLAEFQALGDDAPPFVYLEIGCENWNTFFPAFARLTPLAYMLSQALVPGMTPGAAIHASAYLGYRLGTVFKDVFAAAGLGDRVKRGYWGQRFLDELAWAQSQGYTFECGGPASYFFSTFPPNAWDAYTDPAQVHDLWRWMLEYLLVGQSDYVMNNIATHMPTMEPVYYEGGEDQLTPYPFDGELMAGFYYHPENYGTTTATLANAQRTGFSMINLYAFNKGPNTASGTRWGHAMHNTQAAGLGISPPNLTTAGPDDNLELSDQNTKLQAVRDWLAAAPTPSPTLAAGAGSLALTGGAATLTATADSPFTLAAARGTFATTGGAASLAGSAPPTGVVTARRWFPGLRLRSQRVRSGR